MRAIYVDKHIPRVLLTKILAPIWSDFVWTPLSSARVTYLPDLSLPAEDTPAPIRFLPEFDNLLLSHSNRTRVIADEHRSKVYLPGLRVAATFLVDGFVRGAWKIEKSKNAATLVIEPFDKLTKRDRAELIEEGEGLIRFVEPNARSFDLRFAAEA